MYPIETRQREIDFRFKEAEGIRSKVESFFETHGNPVCPEPPQPVQIRPAPTWDELLAQWKARAEARRQEDEAWKRGENPWAYGPNESNP